MRCTLHYLLIIVSSLFLVHFAVAAPSAPAALVITYNVTALYDEGSFSVNWTSGGGEAEANYTVYVFSNNTLFLVASNDSTTGYDFSNATNALYTFIVGAVNATGFETNSSGNISITVDTTSPTITLLSPTNTTYTSSSIDLNVTSDGTESSWFYSLNGASNLTFSPNTTITGAEGQNNITVWVNDTVGNLNSSTQYFTVDTTGPSITINSPDSGETYSSSAQSVDITSNGVSIWYNWDGDNVTYTSETTVTFSEGSNTLYAYANDSLGNIAKTSVTFTISTVSGSSSSSGKYNLKSYDLSNGYTKSFLKGWSAEVTVLGEVHTFKVDSTNEDTISFTVTSTPQSAQLSVGEEKKFNLNNDGYYDLAVKVNSRSGSLFSITLTSLHEVMSSAVSETDATSTTEETAAEVEEHSGDVATGEGTGEEKSSFWIWMLVLVVVLVAVYFSRRKYFDDWFRNVFRK